MRPRLTSILLMVTPAVLVLALLGAGWWQNLESASRRVGMTVDDAEHGLLVRDVVPNYPGAWAGLQAGDLLVALGDSPIASEAEYDQAARGFVRGQPVTFHVKRDNRLLDLQVKPGVPLEWKNPVLNTVVTLCYLALGLLALAQARHELRLRLLAAFSVAVAIELSFPTRFEAVPGWDLVYTSCYLLLSGLEMGMELHLASLIPRANEWLTSRRWLVPVYYAAGILLGLLTTGPILAEATGVPIIPWRAEDLEQLVLRTGLTLWALAVPVILIAQARLARDPRERNQAALVLLGVAPWSVIMVAYQVYNTFGIDAPDWLTTTQSVVLVMYPVAIFVAISRYRLFDIEFVLKRGLIYGIVTAVLLIPIWLAVLLATRVFADRVQGAPFVLAGTALLIGLLFAPLRSAAKRFVDRRFFPERLAMRQRLTQLAAQLPSHGSLPEMGKRLVNELGSIFGLESVTLLVADPKTGVLLSLASSAPQGSRLSGQSFLLEPNDPAVRLLERAGRPLRADQLAPRSRVLAHRLQGFQAELALGLCSSGSMVGLLLLGRKSGGEQLVAEEMDLLSLFSHMVASVLENAHLFQSATYETLTGLLRREAILAALELEMQRAQRYDRPLAVGMADIDHFKQVNDLHGHLAGDVVLKCVAQTLSYGLRVSDAIGRYGGEEFLFVLPETDLAGAVQVADKLRRMVQELENPTDTEKPVRVTISIGVGELSGTEHGTATVESLIAAADVNLLAAKRMGRNRVVPALDDVVAPAAPAQGGAASS